MRHDMLVLPFVLFIIIIKVDGFAFYINARFLFDYGWILGVSDSLIVRGFELKICPLLQILSVGSIKDSSWKGYFSCELSRCCKKSILFPCFEFSSFLFHCMLSFLCYKSGREVTLYICYVIVVFLSFHYISFYTCLFLKEQLRTWEQEGFFIPICFSSSSSK